MSAEFNMFLIALMFLTRFPVTRELIYQPEYLSKSTVYFPLIGSLIGLLSGAVLWGISGVGFPMIAVLFSMLSTILATGAFHEDGLADSADGFGGGFTKERVLEIMKDSRIGTYGAIALWFVLTTKFFLLYELLINDLTTAWCSLIVAHTIARFSSLPLIKFLDYARMSETASKPFAEDISTGRLVVAFCYTMGIGFIFLGIMSVIAIVITLFICIFGARMMNQRIGGITGDSLGALNQIVELSVYLFVLILHSQSYSLKPIWSF